MNQTIEGWVGLGWISKKNYENRTEPNQSNLIELSHEFNQNGLKLNNFS